MTNGLEVIDGTESILIRHKFCSRLEFIGWNSLTHKAKLLWLNNNYPHPEGKEWEDIEYHGSIVSDEIQSVKLAAVHYIRF